ncbi:MAG: ABC transporter ATP-binding protein [Acutalibacteraceae bacterium]
MPPPGRYVRDRSVKVNIFKNTAFALKIVCQADKRLFLGYLLEYIVELPFESFLKNILFLQVVLGVIDSKGSFEDYLGKLILFAVLSVLLTVFCWVCTYMRQAATKTVLKNLNNRIFSKAISLDVSCYENPEFYDKYQRATQILAWGWFDTVCSCVSQILGSVITLALVTGTVASIDPMYLLLLFPAVFLFVIEAYIGKLFYERDREMTKNNRMKSYIQRTVFLKDFSKDMRTSNIFLVLMEKFKNAIDGNLLILKKYGVKLFLVSLFKSLFSDFIPIIGTYALAAYQFVVTKTMSITSFSVVLSSVTSLQGAIMSIPMQFEILGQGAFHFQNMKDFLEYECTVKSGSLKCDEFESIEFKNVCFRYPTAEKNTLENVSFKIEKGETVALVGINGAGKSTIVKLLLRFYDVTEGEILYNGVNIKEYDLESLRHSFGVVFQDYKNFAVSVYENVMCHECTAEEKIKAAEALKAGGIWDKISSLPKGGDTVLTKEFENDGIGLSGGENQKVSVARLFAKDFSLAVLDEPSSALDPIAEYKMYESLIEVTKGKTVLYISHRLSSAVLSSKIIVIGDGKVVETGSHQQLMEKGGLYCEMFTLQASSYNKEEVGSDE